MKKTLIITIISVIVLALIGGGVVWYFKIQKQEPVNPPVTENNNPVEERENNELTGEVVSGGDEIDTSDWLTYRNEEYGFELKYPQGWEIDIYSEAIIRIIPNNINDPYYAPIAISIRENKYLLEIRDWFIKNYPKNENDIINFSNININGAQALEWYREGASLPIYTYYISKDDIIFQFSLIDSQIDFKKMNNMMKTIIFTFNFIN